MHHYNLNSYLSKFITRMLLILVLVAYNYKTIQHCIKLSCLSIASLGGGEEETPEPKETEGKEEQKENSEYLVDKRSLYFFIADRYYSRQLYNLFYASSDYSRSDYSPPDAA